MLHPFARPWTHAPSATRAISLLAGLLAVASFGQANLACAAELTVEADIRPIFNAAEMAIHDSKTFEVNAARQAVNN